MSPRKQQQGAALLLVMLVVIVAAAAVILDGQKRNSRGILAKNNTQATLSLARDALLDYAVTYQDFSAGLGLRFPCPDLSNTGSTLDGEAHVSACGTKGVAVIGKLPWKTLGIRAPVDSHGNCIWYVVSGDYKESLTTSADLTNADSNGQLQILSAQSGAIVEGAVPSERAVVAIIAPSKPLPGQSRSVRQSDQQQCSDDFDVAAFLDVDTNTGVSNAVLSGVVGIEQFVRSDMSTESFNDQVMTISRRDVAERLYARHDFVTAIETLTFGLSQCIANYGRGNSGGVDDRRLPWPAAVSLSDYRVDSDYDDTTGGLFSGRVPDIVDDSAGATGNSLANVVSNCDPAAVPAWNADMLAAWRNWKDHFFYYVSESYQPAAPTPSNCGNCISVNGSGQYAAVVLFAGRRLASLNQLRDAPPLDADNRHLFSNYLETANSTAHPYTAGTVDLDSGAASATFNDVLYCIDQNLLVLRC